MNGIPSTDVLALGDAARALSEFQEAAHFVGLDPLRQSSPPELVSWLVSQPGPDANGDMRAFRRLVVERLAAHIEPAMQGALGVLLSEARKALAAAQQVTLAAELLAPQVVPLAEARSFFDGEQWPPGEPSAPLPVLVAEGTFTPEEIERIRAGGRLPGVVEINRLRPGTQDGPALWSRNATPYG